MFTYKIKNCYFIENYLGFTFYFLKTSDLYVLKYTFV